MITSQTQELSCFVSSWSGWIIAPVNGPNLVPFWTTSVENTPTWNRLPSCNWRMVKYSGSSAGFFWGEGGKKVWPLAGEWLDVLQLGHCGGIGLTGVIIPCTTNKITWINKLIKYLNPRKRLSSTLEDVQYCGWCSVRGWCSVLLGMLGTVEENHKALWRYFRNCFSPFNTGDPCHYLFADPKISSLVF